VYTLLVTRAEEDSLCWYVRILQPPTHHAQVNSVASTVGRRMDLVIALPGIFGKEISFRRNTPLASEDQERAPLLEDN
jgi:hypothetical protein